MMAFLNSSSLQRQMQPSKLSASGKAVEPPNWIWLRISGTRSKFAESVTQQNGDVSKVGQGLPWETRRLDAYNKRRA
jgi:hypothetical protein